MKWLAAIVAVMFAARSPAQDGEAVTYLGPCGVGCYTFNVSVPGVPDKIVRLRVTFPATRATAWTLLCSGGNGGTFMGAQPGGDILVRSLASRGHVVLERAWEQGWIRSGFGVRPQSRRGAALVSFVAANARANGLPFVAIGNSGGASELAYCLTTWGRFPDRTILCSGPPMTRLQHECAQPPAPAWVQRCNVLLAHSGPFTCGTPVYNNPTGFLCSRLLAPRFLPEDSILHSQARTTFPRPVVLLVGDGDCTAAVCQGLEFGAVTGLPVGLVQGAGHFMPSTAAGRAAILARL